jgi:hypothetical protein
MGAGFRNDLSKDIPVQAKNKIFAWIDFPQMRILLIESRKRPPIPGS